MRVDSHGLLEVQRKPGSSPVYCPELPVQHLWVAAGRASTVVRWRPALVAAAAEIVQAIAQLDSCGDDGDLNSEAVLHQHLAAAERALASVSSGSCARRSAPTTEERQAQ